MRGAPRHDADARWRRPSPPALARPTPAHGRTARRTGDKPHLAHGNLPSTDFWTHSLRAGASAPAGRLKADRRSVLSCPVEEGGDHQVGGPAWFEVGEAVGRVVHEAVEHGYGPAVWKVRPYQAPVSGAAEEVGEARALRVGALPRLGVLFDQAADVERPPAADRDD